MKMKLALFAATMICFAGCARNDTGDMTEDTSSTDTGVGTPATSQSGQSDSSLTSDPSRSAVTGSGTVSLDTNSSSSTLNQDTNNLGQAPAPESGVQNSTPSPIPPAPEQSQPQQGQPPQP